MRSGDVFSVEQTTSYYLSPDGSDHNSGTVTAPWKTFAHAIPLLLPGNTLILLDGIYDGSTSGYPDIRCGTNAQSGAFGRPITLRASHERQAFLKGDGSAHPFHLAGCSDWTIEGLRVENGDFPREGGKQPGTVLLFENARRLTLRRLLAARPNRHFARASVLLVNDGSQSVLVEESEFYFFHWAGVRIAKTSSATLRRNYAHSRDYADLGTATTRYPTVGDSGFWLRLTSNGIVENNIAESVAEGFTLTSEAEDDGASFDSHDDRFLGNVAIGAISVGFNIDSRCSFLGAACSAAATPVRSPLYADDVAVGCSSGFSSSGAVGIQVKGFSAIDSADAGLSLDKDTTASPAFVASGFVSNALVLRLAKYGFRVANQGDWGLDHCNVFGTPSAAGFDPIDAHVVSATALDPGLGSCLVYLPPGSPMSRAGVSGAAIGGEVVFRYEDGALTSQRLWDPSNGAFACGAVVTGVNDSVDSSCIGVHTRLHVGQAGCPSR